MTDDILSSFSDQELLDLTGYNALIDLLQQVKLVHGGEGLKATLSRHKKIMFFLRDFQKRLIIDLEGNISGSHYKPVSNKGD